MIYCTRLLYLNAQETKQWVYEYTRILYSVQTVHMYYTVRVLSSVKGNRAVMHTAYLSRFWNILKLWKKVSLYKKAPTIICIIVVKNKSADKQYTLTNELVSNGLNVAQDLDVTAIERPDGGHKVLAARQHQHVVLCFRVDVADDHHFLVLEHLQVRIFH